jgi:hypothetical protein
MISPGWKKSDEEIHKRPILIGPRDQYRLDIAPAKQRSLMQIHSHPCQVDDDYDLVYSLSHSSGDCRQIRESDSGGCITGRNDDDDSCSEYYSAFDDDEDDHSVNRHYRHIQLRKRCCGSSYASSKPESSRTFHDALEHDMDFDIDFPVTPLPPGTSRLVTYDVRKPEGVQDWDEKTVSEQGEPVPILRIVEACKNCSSSRLSFKLMTTGGACMRLQRNEVVDSVKVLSETHFSAQMFCIKSIDGDSRLVDSSEVVSQVCKFIDQEIAKKRKRYSRMPSWRTQRSER